MFLFLSRLFPQVTMRATFDLEIGDELGIGSAKDTFSPIDRPLSSIEKRNRTALSKFHPKYIFSISLDKQNSKIFQKLNRILLLENTHGSFSLLESGDLKTSDLVQFYIFIEFRR